MTARRILTCPRKTEFCAQKNRPLKTYTVTVHSSGADSSEANLVKGLAHLS